MLMCYCKLFVLISVASTSFAKNDYCQEGTYGNNCEIDCPKQCRPLQTFPCNKDTGRCSEGCINGYYGNHCDVTCSCPSGVCFQESGECIGTGTTTSSTTKNATETIIGCLKGMPNYMIFVLGYAATTAPSVCDGVAAGWLTTAIILIVFIILLVCGVVMMFVCLRFTKQESSHRGTWEITFCKATDANTEKGTGAGFDSKMPLMQEEAGKVATGGQSEIQKPPSDKSEEIKCSMCAAMMGALSRYQYRENDIHSILGLHQNDTNSTYFLMKKEKLTGYKWLYCPDLKFDKETVNVKVAQIDDNMALLNIQDKNPRYKRSFQHFQGTSCTWPLARSGFYQYFEAVFDISLKQPIAEETIVMQLGFCKEKEEGRDKTPFIKINKNCFVVEAVSSKDHNKVCLVSINDGKTWYLQELMNNAEGTATQVVIGISLNKEMKEIGVYDSKQAKLLQKTHINIDEKIWPMFGVCVENEASVSVRLIAGRDIPMWKEKQQTIRAQM